jgi:hypothetical protein
LNSEVPKSPGVSVERNSDRQPENNLNPVSLPLPDTPASFIYELPQFYSSTPIIVTPKVNNDSQKLIDVIPESKSFTSGNSKDQKDTKPEIMEKIPKTRSNISQTKKTKSKEFLTNGKPSDCSSGKESPASDGQPDQIRDKYFLILKKRSLALNESSDDGGRTPSSDTHTKKVFPSILKR